MFGRPPQRPAAAQPTGKNVAHRYEIETSTDGKTFTTILDKTSNEGTRYTEFEELPPTRCRFVRLTLTDWPRAGNLPLGVMDFAVSGKPAPR